LYSNILDPNGFLEVKRTIQFIEENGNSEDIPTPIVNDKDKPTTGNRDPIEVGSPDPDLDES